MPVGTVVTSGALVSPGGQQGPSGPGGPNVVSTDAGNWAILGSDSRIYVPSMIYATMNEPLTVLNLMFNKSKFQ